MRFGFVGRHWATPLLTLFIMSQGVAHEAALANSTTPLPEPRLQVKLHLELEKASVADLCRVLTKRTGITHRPGDVPSGDLLLTAFGDLTAAQLHAGLGEVLGLRWRKVEEKDTLAYVVERTPESAAEESRRQQARERELAQNLRKLGLLADVPADQLRDVPDTWLARLNVPGARDALHLLGALGPSALTAAVSGPPLSIPLASLPPELMRHLQAMKATQESTPLPPGGTRTTADLADGSPWSITIGPGKLQGFPGMYTVDLKLSAPDRRPQTITLSVPAPREPGLRDRGIDPLPHSDAPANHTPVPRELGPELARSRPSWINLAKSIAQTTGRPLLADAYRVSGSIDFGLVQQPKEDDTLDAFLDRANLMRRWGNLEEVLLFRRIDWATLREKQIPDSQYRRWRQNMAETGKLSVDDLLEMTRLTPAQQTEIPAIIAPEAGSALQGHGVLLHLWRDMPPRLREVARTSGMLERELPLSFQRRAHALLADLLGTNEPLKLNSARLLVRDSDEALTYYAESGTLQGTKQVIRLSVRPELVQQIKQEQKAHEALLQSAER